MTPRSLPVRLYHWLQAIAFVLVSQVLAGGEDWHQLLGYMLAGLVVARLLWGLAGAEEDRLGNYMPDRPGLQELINWRHARERTPSLPGRLMALLLMALMLVTASTGHLQLTDRYWGEDWLMALHADLANLLTILVLVHVSTQLWRARQWQQSPLRRMLWIRRRDSERDPDQ